MEIQHQFGILANVLADLVYKENDMMIAAFAADIGFYALSEALNADLIRFRRLFAPIPCCRFAHKANFGQHIHDCILDKVKILPGAFPGTSVFFFKRLPELFKAARFRQPALQISEMRHGAAKALHLIEHFQKDVHNSVLIVLAGGLALGVNIKQDNICRRFCRKLHIRKNHLVANLLALNKVIYGTFSTDFLVL